MIFYLLSFRKISVIANFEGGPILVLSVDLKLGDVSQVKTIPSSRYPVPTSEEIMASLSATFSSAEFNQSILDRGVNLADVNCASLSPGMILIFFDDSICYPFIFMYDTHW